MQLDARTLPRGDEGLVGAQRDGLTAIYGHLFPDEEDRDPADGWVLMPDLGLDDDDEPEDLWVRRWPRAWVRLGVDVAAGGGDELVVARSVGDVATIRHVSKGAANDDPFAVGCVPDRHQARLDVKRAQLAVDDFLDAHRR